MSEAGLAGPVEDHLAGTYLRYGALVYQDGDPFPSLGAPTIGEHTVAILEELGLSGAQIAEVLSKRWARAWKPAATS